MEKLCGRAAEIFVANYYQQLGFRVLDRNYRRKCGEIDLVVLKDGLLLFVEVKARRGDWAPYAGPPAWRRKGQRLRRTIQLYLVEKEVDYDELRLEVVYLTPGRVVTRFEGI